MRVGGMTTKGTSQSRLHQQRMGSNLNWHGSQDEDHNIACHPIHLKWTRVDSSTHHLPILHSSRHTGSLNLSIEPYKLSPAVTLVPLPGMRGSRFNADLGKPGVCARVSIATSIHVDASALRWCCEKLILILQKAVGCTASAWLHRLWGDSLIRLLFSHDCSSLAGCSKNLTGRIS